MMELTAKKVNLNLQVCDITKIEGGFDLTPSPSIKVKEDNEPIIIISRIFIEEGKMEEFNKAFIKNHEQHVSNNTTWIKSHFYTVDKENPHVVHECIWIKNVETFMELALKSMDKDIAKCNLARSTGTVYGGWDYKVKQQLDKRGIHFNYAPLNIGFTRRAESHREGPPTIVSSRRRVKQENMGKILMEYQALADLYRENDLGVLSYLVAPDANDPTLLLVLQIFADDAGFDSHAEKGKENLARIGALYNFDKEDAITGVAWTNDKEKVEI